MFQNSNCFWLSLLSWLSPYPSISKAAISDRPNDLRERRDGCCQTMDLVYTTRNSTSGGPDNNRQWRHHAAVSPPGWTRETNSLCSVSCQNILVFTTAQSSPRDKKAGATGDNKVYCADLNLPWDTRYKL